MVTTFDPQKIAEVSAGRGDEEKIHQIAQEALAWARQVSKEKGSDSRESAYAWDTVEELLAAIAHRRSQQKDQTYLERYCESHPDADECRVYDV